MTRLRGRLSALVIGMVTPLLAAATAQASDVLVTVEGLRSDTGMVRVAICRPGSFTGPSCDIAAVASASDGAVRVTDVPPGTYAVQIHHDENGNGRIDRSALRRPREGIGFSRDAPMRFGPPRFDDAAVVVPEGGGTITVTMRYYR